MCEAVAEFAGSTDDLDQLLLLRLGLVAPVREHLLLGLDSTILK